MQRRGGTLNTTSGASHIISIGQYFAIWIFYEVDLQLSLQENKKFIR